MRFARQILVELLARDQWTPNLYIEPAISLKYLRSDTQPQAFQMGKPKILVYARFQRHVIESGHLNARRRSWSICTNILFLFIFFTIH